MDLSGCMADIISGVRLAPSTRSLFVRPDLNAMQEVAVFHATGTVWRSNNGDSLSALHDVQLTAWLERVDSNAASELVTVLSRPRLQGQASWPADYFP